MPRSRYEYRVGETESKKEGIDLVHTENTTQPMRKIALWYLAVASPLRDGKGDVPSDVWLNTSIMKGSSSSKVTNI